MNENLNKEEQIHEGSQNEELLSDALSELKKHKKKEKHLLTAVFALVIASMGFGYAIWNNKQPDNLTLDYYSGGTPMAYDLSGTAASGGGCGGGGSSAGASGGCCGGGSAAGVPADTQAVETLARDFYKQNFGDDTGLQFKVADYGCHIQIDVYEQGKFIRSLVYRGGQISEY